MKLLVLLAPALLAALSQSTPRAVLPGGVLDAAAGPTGELFVVAAVGPRALSVRVVRGGAESRYALEVDLPAQARIVDVGVAPWLASAESDQVALGLVVEHPEGHSYHFFHNGAQDRLVLSDPIFESHGEPFRLVDVHVTGSTGDGLEITFRRGRLDVRGSSEGLEERLFADTCALGGVLLKGKSILLDVRTGESLALGSAD